MEGRKELKGQDLLIFEEKVTQGTLRVYKSAKPSMPGVIIMLAPEGMGGEEIDLATVQSVEDGEIAEAMGSQDGDALAAGDILLTAYANPYDEDYTSQEALRLSEVKDMVWLETKRRERADG